MFLPVPAYPSSPGQKAVKRLCVCVCVILCRTNIPRKQGGLGEMKIPLLADKSHAISRAYGVLKEEVGNPYR